MSSREYSQKGSAVRMRRLRAREKAEKQARLRGERPPTEVTTWQCGCGFTVAIAGVIDSTLRTFEKMHGNGCMFVRDVRAIERLPKHRKAS